jgi:hypothetical protein
LGGKVVFIGKYEDLGLTGRNEDGRTGTGTETVLEPAGRHLQSSGRLPYEGLDRIHRMIKMEFKCQLPLPSIEKRNRAEMCRSRFELSEHFPDTNHCGRVYCRAHISRSNYFQNNS